MPSAATVPSVTPRRRREPSIAPADLAPLALFQGVDLAWASWRLDGCRVIEMAGGERLLFEGRRSRTVFLVLHGALGIHPDPAEAQPVAIAGVGETVGELAVMRGEPCSAEVRATTAASVIEIDEDSFFCLLYESHQFAINLLLLLSARLRVNTRLIRTVTRHQRGLIRAATIDPLTGLHNRGWLDEMLPRVLERARRERAPLALLLVDADHFKAINDTHGHGMGDRVLAWLGSRLAASLRPGDLAARYGGEEFVVVLPHLTQARAVEVADRLRAEVDGRSRGATDLTPLTPLTISIGVAALVPGDTPAGLVARADAALYRAKGAGRNLVAV